MSGLLGLETAIGALGRGFASAPVTFGGLTLTGVEVPTELEVGGEQQIVVHKLPGGDRVINIMGNDPRRLTLSGVFTGPNTAARYQALATMRAGGSAYTLSVLGMSVLAIIVGFSYRLTQRGIVVPYTLELEVVPRLATSLPTDGTSALAGLIGPDAADAVASVAGTVASAATYVQNTVGQVQSIVGEVAPVASLVGIGGPLAAVSDQLTAASALAGSGTSLADAPATLGGFVTNLQTAGSGLMSVIGSTGGSLTGIAGAAPNGIALDGPSLQDATAQAGVLAGAVQAGGYVNRALAGAAASTGAATPLPVVHS